MIGELKKRLKKLKKGGRKGGKGAEDKRREKGTEGGRGGEHFIILVSYCKQRSQFTLISSSKRFLNSSFVLLLVSS